MRGDMGISTLIIFIVIVLIATVAAVILLNAANSLKNQAQITQEESQAKFSRRLEIQSIYGFVDKNEIPYRIKVIRLTVRVPKGGTSVNLFNTILQFSTEDVIKEATFFDAEGRDFTSFEVKPCSRKDSDVFYYVVERGYEAIVQHYRDSNLLDAVQALEDLYNQFYQGDRYTAGWIICENGDNAHTIYPGQLVNIYYAPPGGLVTDEKVSITLLVNDGGSTTAEFRTPDVFMGSVVRLYPP